MRLEQVAVPTPRVRQVPVRVVATSINLSDWEGLRGWPAYARFRGLGLLRPSRRILGSDLAALVTSVGIGVTRFQAGDAVCGDILAMTGGFAEYAVASEEILALKPAQLSFAEASTLPQAGAIATQAIACAKPGERMLINGADDSTRTDPYDSSWIVAHRPVFGYRRALARDGRYLIVGGTLRALLRVLTIGAAIGALTGRRLGLLTVKQGPQHFAPHAARCASRRCASTSIAYSRSQRCRRHSLLSARVVPGFGDGHVPVDAQATVAPTRSRMVRSGIGADAISRCIPVDLLLSFRIRIPASPPLLTFLTWRAITVAAFSVSVSMSSIMFGLDSFEPYLHSRNCCTMQPAVVRDAPNRACATRARCNDPSGRLGAIDRSLSASCSSPAGQ